MDNSYIEAETAQEDLNHRIQMATASYRPIVRSVKERAHLFAQKPLLEVEMKRLIENPPKEPEELSEESLQGYQQQVLQYITDLKVVQQSLFGSDEELRQTLAEEARCREILYRVDEQLDLCALRCQKMIARNPKIRSAMDQILRNRPKAPEALDIRAIKEYQTLADKYERDAADVLGGYVVKWPRLAQKLKDHIKSLRSAKLVNVEFQQELKEVIKVRTQLLKRIEAGRGSRQSIKKRLERLIDKDESLVTKLVKRDVKLLKQRYRAHLKKIRTELRQIKYRDLRREVKERLTEPEEVRGKTPKSIQQKLEALKVRHIEVLTKHENESRLRDEKLANLFEACRERHEELGRYYQAFQGMPELRDELEKMRHKLEAKQRKLKGDATLAWAAAPSIQALVEGYEQSLTRMHTEASEMEGLIQQLVNGYTEHIEVIKAVENDLGDHEDLKAALNDLIEESLEEKLGIEGIALGQKLLRRKEKRYASLCTRHEKKIAKLRIEKGRRDERIAFQQGKMRLHLDYLEHTEIDLKESYPSAANEIEGHSARMRKEVETCLKRRAKNFNRWDKGATLIRRDHKERLGELASSLRAMGKKMVDGVLKKYEAHLKQLEAKIADDKDKRQILRQINKQKIGIPKRAFTEARVKTYAAMIQERMAKQIERLGF